MSDYEQQLKDERKWLALVLADESKTPDQKLETLARQCEYYAGSFVHGANLASEKLVVDALNSALQGLLVSHTCEAIGTAVDVIKRFNLPRLTIGLSCEP